MKKIAVFLSGPRRYAPLVIARLRSQLPGPFGVFVHLWEADRGPKARTNYDFTNEAVRAQPEVVYFAEEAGFQREDFPEFDGGSNSGSPPHHALGMFLAIMHLCDALARDPQRADYSHVLRIRTDCLLHVQDAEQAWSESGSGVSCNPSLPVNWLSDHLWFGPADSFRRVWHFGSRAALVRAYLRARRNPERLLGQRARRVGVPVAKRFMRWVDYSIIYAKALEQDPAWLQEASVDLSVEQIFAQVDTRFDRKQADDVVTRRGPIPDPLSTWAWCKTWCRRRWETLLGKTGQPRR